MARQKKSTQEAKRPPELFGCAYCARDYTTREAAIEHVSTKHPTKRVRVVRMRRRDEGAEPR